MSSDLMRAMRRSWAWHFVHAISNPKVLRSSSAHGMYFDLLAGLSFLVGAGGAGGGCAGGAGTTCLCEAACDESTPKYLTRCRLGGGTTAARRAMRASGESSIAPAGLVGPLLLEGQKVLLQHLIKGSLVRLPARVDRTRRRRLCARRCLHRGGLSASRSQQVRVARDVQPDR
jgi:hypothetical protein